MGDHRDDTECAEHGRRDATYVCQHLASGADAGFHYGRDDADPDRLWPDAWCDACEDVRASEDGWNARSEAFAGIQLLCDGCYQRARERNWQQDDEAFEALLGDAMEYLQEREAELYARFRLDDYPRWDWNQETAQLIFFRGRPGAGGRGHPVRRQHLHPERRRAGKPSRSMAGK